MRSPSSVFCSVSEHLPPARRQPFPAELATLPHRPWAPKPSEPSISGFSSTKSPFLCAFVVRNPHFRAFRAQNRDFCALLPSETPIFRHFEHKIGIFVSETAIFPWFWPLSSTKWAFCARADRQVASGSVKVTFVQFTAHDNVLQRCLEQGVACSVICTNDAPTKLQPYPALNTCAPARRQPHLAEIWRWRRQSVQMGRPICVCLSSSSMW